MLYGRLTSCNNFVYQKTLIYDIYPILMTKVRDSGGNVRNSGEIEYAVKNSRLENVIHNFA